MEYCPSSDQLLLDCGMDWDRMQNENGQVCQGWKRKQKVSMRVVSNTVGEYVLVISKRARLWRVSLNGSFYGDYIREQWAIEAALQKASEIDGTGQAVRVFYLRSEGVVEVLFKSRNIFEVRTTKSFSQEELKRDSAGSESLS